MLQLFALLRRIAEPIPFLPPFFNPPEISLFWKTSKSQKKAWFIKISKVASFESVEVFRRDPYLALYFSLSSSMIYRLLCLLPSAALFTLTIWPFGPPPIGSALRWRPHKELCFHWSASLSTGVFLPIPANMRPPSSQWIPTKLTSSPTSRSSTPASVSIPLQLFLGSLSTAFLSFPKHVSSLKAKFFSRLRRYAVSLLPNGALIRNSSLFCIKLFFGLFSLTLYPDGFLL